MWTTLCARLVLPNININKRPAKPFPSLAKKGEYFDVPDGIIAHLTRECGGNVHDHRVVDVTCGSFEKEGHETNPHSGAYNDLPQCAAEHAADLESDLEFFSAYRTREEGILHTRNN
jgi:hypothetical protein